MMFLPPDKPIKTCVSEACGDCPVHDTLHCHFTLRDLMCFLLVVFPAFLIGGAGIYHVSGWLLIPWVTLAIGYFGFIEIRILCSHCPHYAEEGNTLKCWANYGSPKIWKYRPGPMTWPEKALFLLGLVLIWGYPLYFLIYDFQVFLLIVYLLTSGGFFMTLKTFFCSQCMNFACPLNTVKKETHRTFFERNPVITEAWGKDIGVPWNKNQKA